MSAYEKQVGGDHYKMKIQPIEFIQRNGLDYVEGNVVKYVSRAGRKGGVEGAISDMRKAAHYCDFVLAQSCEADYAESGNKLVLIDTELYVQENNLSALHYQVIQGAAFPLAMQDVRIAKAIAEHMAVCYERGILEVAS